jgi:hypothetical protein
VPDKSPLLQLLEPLYNFIDEYTDPGLLEEADGYIGLMRPEILDELYTGNTDILNRIIPLYQNAMSNIDYMHIPNLIRAHLIRLFQ